MNTKPVSCHNEPALVRSSFCATQWAFKAAIAISVSLTTAPCRAGAVKGPVSGAGQLPAHLQEFALEVDILPAQTQQFAFPQPGGDSQDVQGSQTVLADVFEQSLGLRWSKWLHLFLRCRGAVTASQTLRGRTSSRTACCRALRKTVWMI